MKKLLFLLALPVFGQQSFRQVTILDEMFIRDRTTPSRNFGIYSTSNVLSIFSSLASANALTLTTAGALSVPDSVTATNSLSTSGFVNAAGYKFSGTTFIDSGGYRAVGGGTYAIDSSRNGSFVGLAMSGNFTGTHAQNIGTGDSPVFAGLEVAGSAVISGSAGTNRNLDFTTGSSLRWIVRASSASESGSNVGSNFEVRRYLDDGVTVDTPISIARSTGDVTVAHNLTVSGTCTGCATAYTGGTGVTVAGSVISIGQAVGTGSSVTFNTITASVNSNLGIAAATSLDVGSGNLTIGSGGALGTNSTIDASGAISSTGSFVRAASSSGFRVGGTTGLSPGATQTLTMRDSAGTSTCTVTVIGGIISATTC